MVWWEDFRVGERSEMGAHTFGEEEILAFGRQFDPQPFHGDPRAAKASVCGGLVASAWHTCAVRPGATLTYARIVVESRASTSRPGVGLVKHRWEAANRAGELVLTMEGWGMFGRRPA